MVELAKLLTAVLTDEAQETCDLLMATAAEHERFAAVATGWVDDDVARARSALSYVMRLVVLVEVFTFQRTLDLSDDHAGKVVSPVFEHLYKAHRKQIESSWDNAFSALTLWPSVAPREYPEWEDGLRGYILARNCWAHGHGRLTARYLNDLKTTTKHLGEAGFEIEAQHVKVKPEQVIVVARRCRAFVRRLDKETSPHLG